LFLTQGVIIFKLYSLVFIFNVDFIH